MAVAYRQNGGVESSGGGGGGSTVASSTQVTVSQLLDSSGGSVQAADSANNAIRVNVVAGAAAGSTLVTVRQSTAGDLQATVTPVAGSTWRVQPGSTLWASSAGFHFDSSGYLQVTQSGAPSTTVNVSSLAGAVIVRSSAADLLATVYQSSAADLNVTVAGYVAPSTIVSVSTGSVRVHQSTAADLQVTATPVAGSTWRTQPGSTLWASSAGFHFDSSGALQVTGGGGAGSTDVSVTQLRDSSGGSISAGDSANQAIRVNVVAGAAGGSTVVTVSRMVGNSSAVDYMPVRIVDSSGTDFVSPGVGFEDGSTASVLEAPGLAFNNGSNATMRLVGSSTPLPVAVSGYVAPSTIVSVSTGSVRVHQSSAADLNVTVAGYVAPSTTVNVSSLAGAVIVRSSAANFLATVYQSTAADLNVTVAGYVAPSTIISVSTGSVRVHQSTATDLLARVNQGVGNSSAADFWNINMRSSAANALVTAYQSSAADLQVTVTPVAGSTWRSQPGSTLWASSAGFHFDGAGNLLVANPEFDSTYVSGSKTSSGDTTLLSSAASTRFNVYSYHFTIDSTTPTLVRLMNGSTVEMARWMFRAPSSISIGANLAVAMPAYLYRTAVANALILHTDSTAAVHYSIAAFRST